ncbi:TIGR03943 family putative permease subunit [Metabacillus idriensis]|uniref:TIGR03943 family putative permease subunit n=1 Tax=Metabacillus idriensis TaxID=324768 RepID=UPI00174A0A09|nr:TIGR03943 family protein [Metabacillus idriensis]
MEKLNEKYQLEFENHDNTEDKPEEYYENFKKEFIQMDKIIITDENFISIMSVHDRFPDSFEGKQIEITGFIFREPDFSETQLVIGRRADPCCADEHDGFYGLLSTTTNASELSDDQWVKVSGTLITTKYLSKKVPYLKIKEVIKIKQPTKPYVSIPK